MMLARVCRATICPQVTSFLKAPVVPKITKVQATRLFSGEGRTTFTRTARSKPGVLENVERPAINTAYDIGKGFGAGAALVGIGCLCFYGAGFGEEVGAIDKSTLWPQYVKDRIKTTYMYFGGSIALSVTSGFLCLTSPATMRLLSRGGWLALGATFAAMIGSGMLVRSIPYEEGLGVKQLAWMLHSGIIGAIIAPLSIVGGPIMLRAALFTVGVAGGLSAVAICAPSKQFLSMGGPLAVGLGAVAASSLATLFVPQTTKFGAGLYSLATFGGLVVFSLLLLYDTQRIIHQAEVHPVVNKNYQGMNPARPYDPINSAISIYLDVINIFVRLVSILAGGGGRRK